MLNPKNNRAQNNPLKNGDRISFSDRTNESKIDKSSRRKFDPSRRTFEARSRVDEENIESLKKATHQSIIEQNRQRSREAWEEKIRQETAPQVNGTGNNEIDSKDSSKGDSLSDRSISPSDNTKSSIDPVRQAAVEQMRELQKNPEAVAYLYQGRIYAFENFKSAKEEAEFGEDTIKKLDNLERLGRGHTVDEVRYIDIEDGINGIRRYGLELVNVPEVEKPQDRQADAIETERLSEAKPDKKRVTFAPNLEEIRLFNDAGFIDGGQNEGVRISSKDGKDAEREAHGRVQTALELTRQNKIIDMGLQDLALQPGTTVYFKNTDGKPIYTFVNRENGSIRLSLHGEAKENEESISVTDAAERIQGGAEVKNEGPIYAARYHEIPVEDNYWPKTLITDDKDAYDHMVQNIGYKPLDEYEKKRYDKVGNFVDPSQIPEDRKWMLGYKLGDFEDFDRGKPLEVRDFTEISQDRPRERDTIHEGEYSAREKIAHDRLITLLGVKQAEKLRLVAQEHLGSSELYIDSTRIAKIRFYAYESREGNLLLTNKKYTEQDYADRGLKPVSLDYAVEKLEYLEAQGAVKWKLPKTYAIRSETNLGDKVVATYDQQLAEEMMTNHGYKELMLGARDGIDLSDRDDPTVDEGIRDNIRKKFDESEDGIKLAKLKKKFDEFSDKLSKRFSEEEVEKRIPKLEEDYDFDYARENIVTQLYFDEMIKKNKLPLSERWEYKMWYREATQPLEKALDDMGREYYRSSLENNKKGNNILKLEKQFEEAKNRLKSNSDISEDVKALSKELAKKHRQYIEARLETEAPNKKSNEALKSIEKHLNKGIEDMNAMEESLSQDEKGQSQMDKVNSPAKRFSDLITSMAPEGYKAKYEEAANDFFKKSKLTNKDIDTIEENKEAIGEVLSKNRDNLQKWIAELSKQLPSPSQDGPYAEAKDLLNREAPIRHGGIIGA